MNVLILSYGNYPNGDAGAVRQHIFGKLFNSLGHKVFVIGMGENNFMSRNNLDGIEYTSFRDPKKDLVTKLKNFFGYKKKLKYFLKTSEIKFDIMLIVEIPLGSLFYAKKFAKKNNIILMHDCVEWYSPEQFRFNRFSIQYTVRDLYNRKFVSKDFRVIAISKFLEEYFRVKGCKTTRIPAILDVWDVTSIKRTSTEKLTLVYAGSPFKKDYLNEIIKGLSLLNEEEIKKLEFRVIGVNKEQLTMACDVRQEDIDKLGNSLKVLGRVSRDIVSKNLEEADFTVLVRSETLRYAKAGFPTKVAESLASATPIICNTTSDLGDYIHDGENGIIINGNSAQEFSKSVRRALSLSVEQRKSMSEKARKSAEENFDYRLYKNNIKDLISEREFS